MERLRYKILSAVLHLGFLSWMYACTDDAPTEILSASLSSTPPQSEHVILVVIDGPRYSDTWGMPGQPYIPYMSQELAPQGALFTNFRNNGPTYTLPGHTALVTGFYQHLSNDGSEHPQKPSVLQQYLQQKGLPPYMASIVTSKEKLNILADCRDINWRGRFNPTVNSGEEGQNRADTATLQAAITTLKEDKPGLMLLQFMGPDVNGHANNWEGYLAALQETDRLVYELWTFLQQDEHYKDKTTLLITNDHGRHATGDKDGFISHGDRCESCEHISLLALGPHIAPGTVVTEDFDQADIAPTIGALMGFSTTPYDGSAIAPLLLP